ncbi:MAG: ankyrin repeat domain-containing protein [Pseudomonadota bacterium]|nr:ankyrin repeat domain-containing protein [Pseudomonadota bacterium]
MSANIIDKRVIAGIVSWSARQDLLDRMGVAGPDELGQILHDENVRSFNTRYNETNAPDTFKHVDEWGDEIGQFNILDQIAHLDYSSCQTNDWNTTKANECLAFIECDYIEQHPHSRKITLHNARHPMVVVALIANGRDPNEAAPMSDLTDQNRPLHSARSPEIASALIDAGADVNGRNANGETPIYTLANFPNANTLNTVIERGGDPMSRDNQGNTPLHSVSHYGSTEAVDVLVGAGADPSSPNNSGKTPVQLCQNDRPAFGSYMEQTVFIRDAEKSAEQLKANTPMIEGGGSGHTAHRPLASAERKPGGRF